MPNTQGKPKIAIITGPTATGKTDAAVELALRLDTEIVSADSMLVYRRMNIGTAKPDARQLKQVRHHMVDVAEPWEDYSAAKWQQGALAAIDGILARGKLPLVVGGTGLYVRAVLYPMEFAGLESGKEEREKWERFLKENGPQALRDELGRVDPASAKRLPVGDTRRMIRALEVYNRTGVTMTEKIAADLEREPRYDALAMGVSLSREVLYARIDARVDNMLEAGLAREVRALLDEGVPEGATSMQGLGYKEMASYIRGEKTLAEAAEEIKRRTRNFAKAAILSVPAAP